MLARLQRNGVPPSALSDTASTHPSPQKHPVRSTRTLCYMYQAFMFTQLSQVYVDAYFSLRFTAGGAGDCAPVAHGGWVCFVEGAQDVLKLQLRFASFTSFRPTSATCSAGRTLPFTVKVALRRQGTYFCGILRREADAWAWPVRLVPLDSHNVPRAGVVRGRWSMGGVKCCSQQWGGRREAPCGYREPSMDAGSQARSSGTTR